jgi:hypothetical protein
VATNPLDGTPFGGGSPDDESVRAARHAEAVPLLADALTEATHHLDLCETAYRHLATIILRDLREHPEHLPSLPQLTSAQYRSLEKIAEGGTTFSRSLRGDWDSIRAGDGSAIPAKPFAVLENNRLVRFQQKSSSPFGPQDVGVTSAGRLVLDTQKPVRTPVPPSAKTAPAATATAGRRR